MIKCMDNPLSVARAVSVLERRVHQAGMRVTMKTDFREYAEVRKSVRPDSDVSAMFDHRCTEDLSDGRGFWLHCHNPEGETVAVLDTGRAKTNLALVSHDAIQLVREVYQGVSGQIFSGEPREASDLDAITAGLDEVVGTVQQIRRTWEQFQAHASYPKPLTTITRTSVTVPAGEYAVQLYEVGDGRGSLKNRVWFADELPGAPIKMESLKDGEVSYLMELLEHRPGQATADTPQTAPSTQTKPADG